MRSSRWRGAAIAAAALFLCALPSTQVNAAVNSSPSINLDGAVASSLAPGNPTIWRDLSNNISFTVETRTTSTSTDGGGSLNVTGKFSPYASGAGYGTASVGSVTNPSGDISVFMWVKFTEWNTTWNLLASRWFTGSGGASANDWHFAVKGNAGVYTLDFITTTNTEISGTKSLQLNTWYLVGVTLNNTTGYAQLYVNGKADGGSQYVGAHTANTSSVFYVGDLRTIAIYAMNGRIAKFRLWNSQLSLATVVADFKSEAADLGVGPTATLSVGTSPATYRIPNTLSTTVSQAGKVTFYEKNRVIPGCKNITVTTTAQCAWKPSTHGGADIKVVLTPTDTATINATSLVTVPIAKRATTR